MHESVSDILIDRARPADGLNRMVLYSLLAHTLLLAAVALMPANWRMSRSSDVTPMMITLAGGTGPDAGGMTQMSNKPVQEVATDAKPAPVAPPAPKAPEMVAPEPKATPAPKNPPKHTERPVDKSSSRKPTTGAEIKTGDARAETGAAPIPFGGLTRPSGGGTSGTAARTDFANFCCPTYLTQMVDLIKRNWNPNQGASGQVQVKFVVHRDGTLTDIEIEKSSSVSLLDLESQRALVKTKALPPLPREFTENTLTVHLNFDYHR
jgi:periplasmic protein TonB